MKIFVTSTDGQNVNFFGLFYDLFIFIIYTLQIGNSQVNGSAKNEKLFL